MDLKKYDELRKKIHTKDFEGKNRGLNNWLYKLSFLGNLGSIFFAYFLVFPALNKAISTNLLQGQWGMVLAMFITILVLVSFETIKRLLIKNLSFDLVKSKFKIMKASILGWFIFSTAIVCLSFYLSLSGARNFASTSVIKNVVIENTMDSQVDSLNIVYGDRISIFENDNTALRSVNTDLRQKLADTPLNYPTTRRGYQDNIDKNTETINTNQARIDELNEELQLVVAELRQDTGAQKTQNKDDDFKNILLFILLSTSIEVLIIVGVYFREYYEYNVYMANQERLESVYIKRDRYSVMLKFIYQEGKLGPNERVMAGAKIIELVEENSRIQNPKKFVENFLQDMETLGIFVTQGKRRLTNATYQEALSLVENFDDALRIFENLK